MKKAKNKRNVAPVALWVEIETIQSTTVSSLPRWMCCKVIMISAEKNYIKVSYKLQITIMINWNAAQTRTLYTQIENGLQTLDGNKLGSLVRDSTTEFGKKAIDHP